MLVCWYDFFQLSYMYFAFIFGIFPKIQNPLLWTYYGSNSILLLFYFASLILTGVTTSLLPAALASPLFLSVWGVAERRPQGAAAWIVLNLTRRPLACLHLQAI